MEENENTVMPVSKRPAPKKIFIPPPKPESQKNYKEIKVTTKEGSIESGVQLSKGTITVKKIHGKGLMIEKDDIVYEMVTKRGSGMNGIN